VTGAGHPDPVGDNARDIQNNGRLLLQDLLITEVIGVEGEENARALGRGSRPKDT